MSTDEFKTVSQASAWLAVERKLTLYGELTRVSASIIVNLPWQRTASRAGRGLPYVITDDLWVFRALGESYQSQMGY